MQHDDQAVQAIADLALKGAEIKKVGDVAYVPVGHHALIPEFHPAPLSFQTLTGLVDYLTENVDHIGEVFIHVKDFDKVEIKSPFVGIKKERATFAIAEAPAVAEFPFGRYISGEEFSIKARSMFVRNPDLDEIIAYLTKVDISSGVQTSDNGISQGIMIKKGISGAMTDLKTTKGFYSLIPYRTFQEIDQPESEFVFRLKDKDGLPEAALFSSGSNQWKLDAIQKIKNWLLNNIPAGISVLA